MRTQWQWQWQWQWLRAYSTGWTENRVAVPEWVICGARLVDGREGIDITIAGGRFLDVGVPDGLIDAQQFPIVWDGRGEPPSGALAPGAIGLVSERRA